MLRLGSGQEPSDVFDQIEIADRLNEDRLRNVAASGNVAGVYGRTDINHGLWKAPAGSEAVLRGASIVTQLGDLASGELKTVGVNVLRSFPVLGTVVWGARTLDIGFAPLKPAEFVIIKIQQFAGQIES